MLNRLITRFPAPRRARSYQTRSSVIFMALGLLLFGGCGGSQRQVVTPQMVAQLKSPDLNQELQQQAMRQGSRATLTDYKDYRVGQEDLLVVEIFGQEKMGRTVRVNGQGEITLPLVGTVKVAGQTTQEIQTHLGELYNAQYLVNPQITVAVKEFRHQRVAITGAVANPGPYEIMGPRSLLEVLSLAGGLSTKTGGAAGDVVSVIRHQNAADLAKTMKPGTTNPVAPPNETIIIDLKRLVSGKDPGLNILVHGGDVVHVAFAGTAYVLGGVRKPGNILVRENLTVSQAVSLGGGVDPILGTNSITIMRFDEQGKPVKIAMNLNRIIEGSDPDLPVKDNDVVVVKESSIKKALYVIRQLVPVPSGGYTF